MKLMSRENIQLQIMRTKAALFVAAASAYAPNANASVLGTLLTDGTGSKIISFFFMGWGASIILDAVGTMISGGQGATKQAIQGALLMVFGWKWAEMIKALGFVEGT